MTVYWIPGGAFCPMDHGMMEEVGEVTVKTLRCPRCGNNYAFMPGSFEFSDGFIRPKEVVCNAPARDNFHVGTVLRMTVLKGE